MEAFAIRLPYDGSARLTEQVGAREDRLAAAGWDISLISSQGIAAALHTASHETNKDLLAAGIVRLNNSKELRTLVGAPHNDSDLGVLLALRQTFGPDFVQRLSGAFSFVIYDQVTGHVEGYRDHFGIYPFYYCIHEHALICSSDIRVVLHLSGLPIRIDPTRLADFLMGQQIDAVSTAFLGLIRLPAAHVLTGKDYGIETTRYWSLKASHTETHHDLVHKALRDKLQFASDASLAGTKPVGAMLSGGLDSSTLVALAATRLHTQKKPPLPTFSFVYGADKGFDERSYIKAVNDQFVTDPYLMEQSTHPRFDEMDSLIEDQMDLFQAPGLLKSRRIYSVAKAQGLSALIDGHGGDEVISHGYARLIELAAARKWLTLLVNMRGVGNVYGSSYWGQYLFYIGNYGRFSERSFLRRAVLKIARILVKPDSRKSLFETQQSLLAPQLLEGFDPIQRYTAKPTPSTPEELLNAETHAHLATFENAMTAHTFEVLHRTAAAAGIEPRYPFYERSLVEFCVSVPSKAKLRDGFTRWVLRKAMQDILPSRICWRKDKADFSDEARRSVNAFLKTCVPQSFKSLNTYIDPEVAQAICTGVTDGTKKERRSHETAWRLATLIKWDAAFRRWQAHQLAGTLI